MKHERILALTLAGLALFAPVAKGGEAPQAALSETCEQTEGAPTGTLAVDPTLRSFGLYKRLQHYEDTAEGKVMLRQQWPELYLQDCDGRSMLSMTNFPNLEKVLAAYNRSVKEEAVRLQKEMRKEARQDYALRKEDGYGEYFGGYTWEKDILIKRADSLALSFVEVCWTYTGGAHGMTIHTGMNFDAVTGARLELKDVFLDANQLTGVILEKLQEENHPGTFSDSLESIVADGVLHEKVSWVLGPRGVTFIYNPYEIAAYASGTITVTIPFDERPGLFREKYMRGPASYCEELPLYREVAVQRKDDGVGIQDMVGVSVVTQADEGCTLRVTLNGQERLDSPVGQEARPVFVHRGNGRNYLYIDCMGAGPGSAGAWELRVYDMDGEVPELIGTEPLSFRNMLDLTGTGENWTGYWIMTDPEEFWIDDNHISEGSVARSHPVGIGENGMPAFG